VTDGTTTAVLSNIAAPDTSSFPAVLGDVNGKLLFEARDQTNSVELWGSDGTAAGTTLLSSLSSSTTTESAFATLGGFGFFGSGQSSLSSFWKTNGTAGGTSNLGSDLGLNMDRVANVNGTVFFVTTNTLTYKSDGTAAGTVYLGASGTSSKFIAAGTRVVVPNIPVSSYVPSIWTTDLTQAGSMMLKDSAGGTLSLSSPEGAALGDLAYFQGGSPAGYGLFQTDGTNAGTTLTVPLEQGPGTVRYSPLFTQPFANVNGLLFFSGYSAANGYELWTTDGTAVGTALLKDLAPGPQSSTPIAFTPMNGVLYFIADDGTSGYELWRSDGTSVGTVRVTDIAPGPTSAFTRSSTLTALPAAGLLFFAASDGSSGVEPWRSDGTAAGTWQVGDISPGTASSNPATFALSGTTVFFSANDGVTGRELWSAPTATFTVVCPAGASTEASSAAGNVLTYAAAKSFGGTAPTTFSYSVPSGARFPLGTTFVAVSATDATGAVVTCTFQETVRDTTAPLVTCPASITINATAVTTPVTWPAPTATDAVSTPVITVSRSSGDSFPVGRTTVSVTATDAAKNAARCTFVVTVVDPPPVISCPVDLIAEATSSAGAPVTLPQATATDVTGPPTVTETPVQTPYPIGSTTITATATNLGGVRSTCTFHVIVRDTTPPTITCPANVTTEATDPTGASVRWPAATVTDVSSWTLSQTAAPGAFFPIGTTPVTLTATDAHQNASSCTFQVTVQDTTPPSVACPANITQEATSSGGAVVTFALPTVTDAGSAKPVVTTSRASGTTFPLGTTTVTALATDQAGNVGTCSFSVLVRASTAPFVICTGATVEQTSAAGAVVTFPVATALDQVSQPVIAYSREQGSLFPPGTTPVVATAIDAAGNAGNCTFFVSVRDTTPPVISCPATVTAEATSASGAVVSYPAATATDAVSATVTGSPASGTTFPLGTTRVTATARDRAGNSSTCAFTVVVVDTTPPGIVCPANVVAEATGSGGAVVAWPNVTATDLVSLQTVTSSPAPNTMFPVGATTVTARATDAAGNAASCSFVVTVADTTPPTISCPADIRVVTASPSGTTVNFVPATATDPVSIPTVASSIRSGTSFPPGSTTVTVTATDAAGNSARCTFQVVVDLAPLPVITCPADISAEATSSRGAAVTFAAPTVSDWLNSIVDVTPSSGSIFPLGATRVVATALDSAERTATCSFVVLVVDQTAPAITCPPTVTVEQTSALGAVATGPRATASDAVSTPTVTDSITTGTLLPPGNTSIVATATDASGNTSSCSFQVTVVDRTPPVITCPGNVSVKANSPAGAVVTYPVAVAMDAGSVPTMTASMASGALFPLGATAVTQTATDAAGHQARCSFQILVAAGPPVLTCPGVLTVEATSAAGAVVQWPDVAVADPFSPAVVFWSQPDGTLFPLGYSVVTVTAVDGLGTTASCPVDLEVVDATAPALRCPGDLTAEASAAYGTFVPLPLATATDAVSTPDVTVAEPPGALFPLGVTPVPVTATDAAGNTSDCTFRVTVRDTTPPALVCPDNLTAEATTPGGAAVAWATPVASDVVSSVRVSSLPASQETFPVGETPVVVTASDATGNSTQCNFTVTVLDTTPPDITCPQDLTVEATEATGAEVIFPAATSTDAASIPVVTLAPATNLFPLGATPVIATSTDGAGNTASCAFIVTVVDTAPPVITCPQDLTIEATSNRGAIATWMEIQASDDVSMATVTTSPDAGSLFAFGRTTVTAYATDLAGNAASCSFVVLVQDTAPPTIRCPQDLTIEALSGAGAPADPPGAAALDMASDVTITSSVSPGSQLPLGITEVIDLATDAAGNQAACQFTVTVRDTTPPALHCPDALSFEAQDASGAEVDLPAPDAMDAVSTMPTVTFSPPSGGLFPLGSTNVSVTAADEAGNSASCLFPVVVVDTTPPALACPTDQVVEAVSSAGATVTWDAPQATDAVSAVSLTATPSSGSMLPLGVTPVAIAATDASANQTTCWFQVTVQDTTPPHVECPADRTVHALTTAGAPVTWPPIVATDVVTESPTVTTSQTVATLFRVGTTIVTATATDAAGNRSTCQFQVHVVPTERTVRAGCNCSEASGASGLWVVLAGWATLRTRKRVRRPL
jgi:ELWxxDGT repeat protein